MKLARLRSEVPGLDTILGGGLVDGSSYIIQGRPGAGKTILANQIAFAHARQGRRVLYITLLAESHDRLFQSLSTLSYYDASRLGHELTYLSLFRTLREEGLSALVRTLRQELLRQGSSLLVLDGLLNARESGSTNLDVKAFVAELQAHAAFTGCTVLFLTSARIDDSSPEHTMVDGVIELQEELMGVRTVRNMRVAKSRGSSALGGTHQYEIGDDGIVIYPRLEAEFNRPSEPESLDSRRFPSGVRAFDEVVHGGLPEASITVLAGPAGSGKTTFGLNYLRLATPEAPALHFGFFETPARLALKARTLGIDIAALVESGALHILWNPPTENLVDGLAHQLLHAVRELRVRRLFLDGLAGFERSSLDRSRITAFFAALTNELRATGVTTVATWETRDAGGLPPTDLSPVILSLMDNLAVLRQVEIDGELRRALSVIKVRDSDFKSSVHEVRIVPGEGMTVVGILRSAGATAVPAGDSLAGDAPA
ncbi:ATPase domain-containing protein [Paraburkholderia sp.]|uniref:ATPase domain-containing protein n=1 Tax=Paraburkholderia sp. TaxID=1926495 RepID=UPI00239A759C|nr:ATPase domain-containing protein [Paraburkholderia sp.]MDE1179850.1 ATPase domain-containing protein [Paraburkholderia sp.]